MGTQPANPDRRVAEIAARQHGVVDFGQLVGAGLSGRQIVIRRRKGHLHPIYRGVYAVGHDGLSWNGRWMAAVLAGESATRVAFLSHRSAAALWGFLSPDTKLIEIVIPGTGKSAKRAGLRVHRSLILGPDDTRRRYAIPVTSPARTVFDLEREPRKWRLSGPRLREALRQAAALSYPLGGERVLDGTRSELESRFLRLCRRNSLPAPEVNVRVGRFVVDFLWSEKNLIVETDGYRFHSGKTAFEDDRGRDLELRSRGFEVIRLTHRQVKDEGDRVSAVLRSLL